MLGSLTDSRPQQLRENAHYNKEKNMKLKMATLCVAAMTMVGFRPTPAAATPVTFNFNNGSTTGMATFNIGAGFIDVTLSNTTGGGLPWLGSIASTLVGVSFTTTGGTVSSLATVTATGAFNCFGLVVGTPCAPVAPGASPNNWKWGTNTNTPILGLYVDQLKPNGLVNSMVLSSDGLNANAVHNPVLGPTTFHLLTTGNPTAISAVNFYIGTDGDHVLGTACGDGCPGTNQVTPEPVSAVLTGSGLLGLAAYGRRKIKASKAKARQAA